MERQVVPREGISVAQNFSICGVLDSVPERESALRTHDLARLHDQDDSGGRKQGTYHRHGEPVVSVAKGPDRYVVMDDCTGGWSERALSVGSNVAVTN